MYVRLGAITLLTRFLFLAHCLAVEASVNKTASPPSGTATYPKMFVPLASVRPSAAIWRSFFPSNSESAKNSKPFIVLKTLAGKWIMPWPSIIPGGSCTRSTAPPSPRCASASLAFRAVRAHCAAPPRARFATLLLASSVARACISRQNAIPSSRSHVYKRLFCSRRFECHSIVLRNVLIQNTTRCLKQ